MVCALPTAALRCRGAVAATLALFLALSGTAIAGAKLLITGADVKNHSLTGVEFENGSLGLGTLSPAARTRLQGARGAVGAPGPQGQQGTQGLAGQQGTAGPQGATGVDVTTATAAGADVTGYQDPTPLASYPLPVAATT